MGRPQVHIERDASMRCWEISLIGPHRDHVAQVFFYDDGRTDVKAFTGEEIIAGLAADIYAVLREREGEGDAGIRA